MMDDQRSEDLKCQIAETRSKLADKLETLEEQILEPAAAAVTETVTTVKEAVGDTAEAVQATMQKMTETFDLAAHVRKHPWEMLGASVAAGFLLGHFGKARASAVPTALSESEQATESAAASRSPNRAGEGWGKLGAEMQSMLIHALAPVCQGFVGAVLAELLRPARANPSEVSPPPATGSPSLKLVQDGPEWNEEEHEGWPVSDSEREQDWGSRLRSTPR